MLDESDDPAVVIFFAKADVLSGLFTLANYDEVEPNGVIAPFGAGCSTIVMYPYLERDADRPRAVLGMFDVSARPFVQPGIGAMRARTSFAARHHRRGALDFAGSYWFESHCPLQFWFGSSHWFFSLSSGKF